MTYKTAKDFYIKNSISCTYAYYAKVEAGTLPDIAIALELIDKLKMNPRKSLYAWARDHMPNAEAKAFFTEFDDAPTLSTEQRSNDRSLVVNRMQARLLIQNPIYWEIVVFVSSYFGKKDLKPKDVAKAFDLSLDKADELLELLYDYGLINKSDLNAYSTKEWIFIPYEEEFKPIRDLNFKRSFEQFVKVDPTRQFRTTITCLLQHTHQKIIESKVIALTNFVIDLSEREGSENGVPYTIGLFSSPRKFGND